MGKATKWLRALLGFKKPADATNPPPLPSSPSPATSRSREKRRWSFVKSYREKDHHNHLSSHSQRGGAASHGTDKTVHSEEDPSRHAIAVAAATAAVAEAAVAAAQAAAEVVRLTSTGRNGNGNSNSSNTAAYVSGSNSYSAAWRDDVDLLSAAVKIQSAFRGYLARRALRALKSLVRLQALVRGHIERKRTAEWLHRMQALLRAQTRARSGRVKISESSSHSSCKSSHFHQTGPPTPEKIEHSIRARSGKYEQSQKLKRNASKSNSRTLGGDNEVAHLSLNRSERRMEERAWDHWKHSTRTAMAEDENIDKILEIDPGKPHFTPKGRNLFHSSHLAMGPDQYSHSFTTSKDSTTHQTVQSPSSGGEVQSLSPLKFSQLEEAYCTAANSPQLYSATSSKGGSANITPFTPTKSDGSRSFISGYSDHPNYMSTTESSKAKVRSLSAPRQRPQYDRSSSTKRYSILGFSGEARSSSAQQASALRSSFSSKAYPGSGRLDRLGMPVGQIY